MRTCAAVSLLIVAAPAFAGDQMTWQDRVEITRGISAEYATVKVLLPRSRKPLEFNSDGTWDKNAWGEIAKTTGPAARTGDLVQITKVEIGADRIDLQINGGYKGGKHWYQGVQISGGMGGAGNSRPISQNDSNAVAGTALVLLFHKPLEPIKASEIKKILAPVLDFEKRTVTEVYSESLPPAVQKAIKDKHVLEGMTRDQVLMAVGRPQHKSRETADGIETEDWVYGIPPGKITFVTFIGDKVTKVKEEYAGLGTVAQEPGK